MHKQANALKIKTKPENRRFHFGLSLDNDHRLMPGQQHHCGKVGVAAAKAFTRTWGILCLSVADRAVGNDGLPAPARLLV